MKGSRSLLGKTCFYVILIIFALPTCIFLWFMVKGVFQSSEELRTQIGPAIYELDGYALWNWFPKEFSLLPKLKVLSNTAEFRIAFENSFIIALPTVIGQLCIAAPAAWALSRLRFSGKKVLLTLYICLMILPFQVTMLPNYIVIDMLQLMNNPLAVILPYAFSAFPVYIMARGFDSVDYAMLDAAKVDGAGYLVTFYKIGLPIGKPGVAAALLLGFLECWNAVEQPMTFLKSSIWWPLSLYLPKLLSRDLGMAMIASFLMIFPPMIAFLIGHKSLMLGIQFSGIKE